MNAPNQRSVRAITAILVSLVATYWYSGVSFGKLLDAQGLSNLTAVLDGLGRPDLSAETLERTAGLAWDSLLIGFLGTALAVLLAVPLSIFAAHFGSLPDAPGRRFVSEAARRVVRSVSRALLALFRSVPEIIWAFLFVRILGLGPGAAVLAIALTFSGIIGKLFAELIEAADQSPARHLRASGCGTWGVFVYGILPLVRRQWVGYALFRLECAIRSASILGIVGAGGLGQEIQLSIRYFEYDKLATALIAVLGYVVVLDLSSLVLRRLHPLWSVICFISGATVSFLALEIPWAELASIANWHLVQSFFQGFAEPTLNWSYVVNAAGLLAETVSMAWIGTIVAAVAAMFLAPLAATKFTVASYLSDAPQPVARIKGLMWLILSLVRGLLQVTRALPELVWALLFVLWVGPGVTAGVLALAIHTVGVLGRLYGDTLEEAELALPRAMEMRGSSKFACFVYGIFPQVAPRLVAYTLFRFEVNVRGAAMVGFVGAGGLGDALHTAISLFQMSELATLLTITLLVVFVVDALGDRLRSRILAP